MAVSFSDISAQTQQLKKLLDEAFQRVLSQGQFIRGPENEAFEQEFAAYCGTKHCIGVGSGLSALELILNAYGIGAGDEVIVPSNTYIATWLAVTNVGATPVPVEPDVHHNINPLNIEEAITPHTRAILAVHLYGMPADMDAIGKIAKKHRLFVFEDAAQAHGATYKGRKTGNLSHAAGFSFYPTKNLGCYGDGGAVVTSDKAIAEKIRMLANYGSKQKNQHVITGTNSRLDELQAAFLRIKLKKLDAWNRRRREIAAHYHRELSGVKAVALPQSVAGAEPVWHQFVIRTKRRDALASGLASRGIPTLIHYPTPPHLSGAYSQMHIGKSNLPLAELFAHEVLSLPMGIHLTESDVVGISKNISAVCAEF